MTIFELVHLRNLDTSSLSSAEKVRWQVDSLLCSTLQRHERFLLAWSIGRSRTMYADYVVPSNVRRSGIILRNLRKIAKSNSQLRHVCLPVRPHGSLGSRCTDFHEICYLSTFTQSV